MATKTLKTSVLIGGSVSSAFRSALASTKNGLKQIGEAVADVDRKQRLMAQSINTFGRMGKNVDGLRTKYAALQQQAERLRASHSRLADVQQRMEANRSAREEIGGQLRGAVGSTAAIAASMLFPIKEAASFETAMLGVAKQIDGARDKSGNLTRVYFDMARQIKQLGREIPIPTNQIAEMTAAGARMGVARKDLIGFVRTTAMMGDAFEMPAAQIADEMGKIAGLFHLPIPRIGELADAINHLDDNSQATGAGIIDVMRRIGGMAQTLKMPAKEAAALGSTFLTLGSSAEVAGTASNAVMRILGAATAQSKRVREGLESIGFNPADIQSSMSRDASGTILKLLDKLNRLNGEQRMVASTRIFGAEYGDDIAKLATGTAEYRRQLALVNSEAQRGSMSREFSARLKTTGAQWEITKNRMRETAVVIGSALVPAVNSLLKVAGPAFGTISAWAERNPGLVKGIAGAALALSGLKVATLAVRYAWVAAQGPVLSTMGFIARWRATGAISALGRFGPAALRVANAVRWIATGIGAIGAGPIVAIGAAVVGVALVIRKYWQPIRAWLGGFFDGIRQSVAPAMSELGAAFAPLKPVWDSIAGAVGKAWAWFTKLLTPVNMTSEQLKAAGESGAQFGRIVGGVMAFVVRRITSVVNAIKWVTANIGKVASAATMIPGVGLALQGARMLGVGGTPSSAPGPSPAPLRGRVPPALPKPRANAGPGGGVTVNQQNSFHITQQPGESSEAFARRVAAEMKRQDAVARRGRLSDEV